MVDSTLGFPENLHFQGESVLILPKENNITGRRTPSKAFKSFPSKASKYVYYKHRKTSEVSRERWVNWKIRRQARGGRTCTEWQQRGILAYTLERLGSHQPLGAVLVLEIHDGDFLTMGFETQRKTDLLALSDNEKMDGENKEGGVDANTFSEGSMALSY